MVTRCCSGSKVAQRQWLQGAKPGSDGCGNWCTTLRTKIMPDFFSVTDVHFLPWRCRRGVASPSPLSHCLQVKYEIRRARSVMTTSSMSFVFGSTVKENKSHDRSTESHRHNSNEDHICLSFYMLSKKISHVIKPNS
jgi:hypothetical protein